MKILHYGLGFPPYRSGGMTKFTLDLMEQQMKDGHEVAMIWPGHYSIFGKKTRIHYCGEKKGIKSYEIVNPNPVSYDEGINQISPFIFEGDLGCYKTFLEKYKPDVVHIETLMGIQKNFIVAAKKMGIKIFFSAHDFYPICPKVTLYRNNNICNSVKKCEHCEECNKSALPINKIKILQSVTYRTLKNSAIVSWMRKKHRDSFFEDESSSSSENKVSSPQKIEMYKQLRQYYASILGLCDLVHYNSKITQKVYSQYLEDYKSIVIPISHSNIKDQRRIKSFGNKLKITYLGPYSGAKGFYYLKNNLDLLYDEQYKFCLNVFFRKDNLPLYMVQHDRYSYNELEKIFDETDILIVPSIWNETFGYTVLEALSYGVPVVVSSHVGAQDIIPPNAGIIYDPKDEKALFNVLKGLTQEELKMMNKAICESDMAMNIEQMSYQIENKLYNNDIQ